jgi:hypothetical protein
MLTWKHWFGGASQFCGVGSRHAANDLAYALGMFSLYVGQLSGFGAKGNALG